MAKILFSSKKSRPLYMTVTAF